MFYDTYGKNGTYVGNPQNNGTKSLGQTAISRLAPLIQEIFLSGLVLKIAVAGEILNFILIIRLTGGLSLSPRIQQVIESIFKKKASDNKKSSAEYQEFTSYKLHDFYSNQVKSGSFNGSSAEIDISTLEKGIYILNLQTRSENITKKIAVQYNTLL